MRFVACAITLVVMAAFGSGMLALTGCGDSDASQVQVVTSVSDANTGDLTPLEKGTVRREVLAVAQKGIDAWLTGDPDTMASYFPQEWVDYYRKLNTTYSEEGRTRVRKHNKVTLLDVTELRPDGGEAIVTYDFTDISYFADKNGTQLSKPSNKATEFQLTLDRDPKTKTWRIVRMIGGNEYLQ